MGGQQEREKLMAELKRHGLPRGYIQRLLEELDDHTADLQDERSPKMSVAKKPEADTTELQAADILNLHRRLGDPEQLAAYAAKQYHNRSFLGRHPMLTFLVMPLPLTVLGIAAISLVFYLTSFLFDFIGLGGESFVFDHQILAAVLATFVLSTIIILPPFLTGLLLCRIARRNALKWWWYIAGCAIVAFYCGQVGVGYNLPNVKPSDGFMFICLGCFPVHWRWVVFHFLPKFLFAMGICFVLIRRAQRLQKLDEDRPEGPMLQQAA